MSGAGETERVGTLVIGASQAGLAMGYHLSRRGLPFVIVDAHPRVGDAWRNRWDSLRLFTPARYDALPGMRMELPPRAYPTKDEMADYLEAYAQRFGLPVRTGVRIDRLSREGERFVATAGALRFEAEQVVVAMSNAQRPEVPAFAAELAPTIRQITSFEYRNPSALRAGGVLVVGAGNSGAEIALDAVRHHPTWLSGRDVGHVPFHIDGLFGRLIGVPLVVRLFFHRIATVRTPIGRKVRAKIFSAGDTLVRTKPWDLDAAGVRRVPRTVGARDGRPLLEDGRVLDVANVIWCTGRRSGFDGWIDLPVLDGDLPVHELGCAVGQPGLYFLGIPFIYAASSGMVQGVGRDAERIARLIAARAADRPATSLQPAGAAAAA